MNNFNEALFSTEYKQKVVQIFGKDGELWVNNIPNIINKYVSKFNFYNIRFVDNPTFNIVFFAENEEFGKAIIKVELPHNELLFREIAALDLLNKNDVCKCYYHDIQDGVIILERLLPGESLRDIGSREKRILEFCKIAKSISTKVNQCCVLPTYQSIYERSMLNCVNNPSAYKLLKDHLNRGYSVYKSMLQQDGELYVLHADLHHDNILTSTDSRKAIDPHGFVGCKVLEYARFIEEEIKNDEDKQNSIHNVIREISKQTQVSISDLYKALYVDLNLSTSWDIEIGSGDAHIMKDIETLDIIGQMLAINEKDFLIDQEQQIQ